MNELGLNVPPSLAENAFHSITLSSIIGRQHAKLVLKLEALPLGTVAPVSEPFEHSCQEVGPVDSK